MEGKGKTEDMTAVSYGTCRHCGARTAYPAVRVCSSCWERTEVPRYREWEKGFAGSGEEDDE